MESPSSSGLQSVAKRSNVKKPRLTYSEKLEIIDLLDANSKQSEVANKFHVSQGAISRIYAKRHEIAQNKEILEKGNISLTRKRVSDVITSDREHKLMKWVTCNQAAGVPVSGKSIREAARIFNESCNGPSNFKAANGFLDKFRKRHGIRSQCVQGEKLAESDDAREFVDAFSNYVKDFGFDRDQLYNADESGLLWKDLPTRTMKTEIDKSASGWKLQKDRVTLMFCTNASGTHRIPLYMIGKYKTPRCLEGLNKSSLPTVYTNQKSAWMDNARFITWYKEVFLPEIEARFNDTGKKSILLLDNAPTHSDVEFVNSLSDICLVIYLPPNVTSLIQPMNQGVIEKFKRLYRQNMLRDLLLSNHPQPVSQFLKSMNMYKCIQFCNQAWNDLTQSNLVNAWDKLLGKEDEHADSNSEEDCTNYFVLNIRRLPEFQNLTANDIATWYSSDDMYPGWNLQTVHEMAAETSTEVEGDVEEDEEAPDNIPVQVPSSSRASEFGEQFLKWCYSRWDFLPIQYSMLESMVHTASKVAYENKFSNS